MGFVIRGIKNAFRNISRTTSVVVILALSLGLALAMLLSHQAVQTKIDGVKSSIGNIITVTPAGSRGFVGEGNPLTMADLKLIQTSAHVTKVTSSINDRWNTVATTATPVVNSESAGTTNLISPVIPGALGIRFGGRGGGGNASGATQNTTPPIRVVGTNDPTNTQISGVNSFTITAGSNIDGNGSKNEALLGKDLAAKNNLSPGSSFTAYGQTITVTGIYDTGNTFTNASVIMPLASLQTLSGQPSDITTAIVEVDSIGNVPSAVTALQNTLGTKADVVSAQDNSTRALAPLTSIGTISLYSFFGALASGAIIIFLIMLMIVRERRREIGVLKAIGASNFRVVSQFVVEALVFTGLGSIIGIALGAIFSSSITQLLLSNATSSMATGPGPSGSGVVVSGSGPQGGGFRQAFGNAVIGNARSILNIQSQVDYHIILYGLGAALAIAIIGSAIPAYLIARIRPAEVLRSDG